MKSLSPPGISGRKQGARCCPSVSSGCGSILAWKQGLYAFLLRKQSFSVFPWRKKGRSCCTRACSDRFTAGKQRFLIFPWRKKGRSCCSRACPGRFTTGKQRFSVFPRRKKRRALFLRLNSRCRNRIAARKQWLRIPVGAEGTSRCRYSLFRLGRNERSPGREQRLPVPARSRVSITIAGGRISKQGTHAGNSSSPRI